MEKKYGAAVNSRNAFVDWDEKKKPMKSTLDSTLTRYFRKLLIEHIKRMMRQMKRNTPIYNNCN